MTADDPRASFRETVDAMVPMHLDLAGSDDFDAPVELELRDPLHRALGRHATRELVREAIDAAD